MKKVFFSLALILASVCMANAQMVNDGMFNSDVEMFGRSVYTGTYSGHATPTIMNGIPLSSGKQYACDFTIDGNDYLQGSFTVGPHVVNMQSLTALNGPGTYNVTGTIRILIGTYNFTGTITVTSMDGTNLAFHCSVYTAWGLNSQFNFSGTKQP